MSQERVEILRMVSEKVISVQEAERLLLALDEGDRRRETGPRSRRGGSLSDRLEGLGEMLGGIGAMVQSAVQDAVEDVDVDLRIGGEDEPDLESVELDEGGFTVPEGVRLEIKQKKRHGRITGGSLELIGVEGDRCLLQGGADGALRVDRGRSKIRILWGGGSLVVKVPSTAASVAAKVMGGDIGARGLHCPLEAKTMGGNLRLEDLSHEFQGKTMGGTIELAVPAGLKGDCRAVTMGGDVSVRLAEGLVAQVKAVTMGGQVEVDPELGTPKSDRSMVRQKTTLQVGSPSADRSSASLSLKTMGGNIHLRRMIP